MFPWLRGMRLEDAQQSGLNFLVSQLTIIEPGVYRTQYPEFQYANLLPVDTTGNEWAKSITFFSLDTVGRAQWFHASANDIPVADVTRAKFEQGIEMAGIGYRYNLEELAQAMAANFALTPERALAARRAYEEFAEEVGMRGDLDKGWEGITNRTDVTAVDAPATGTGSSRYWADKDASLILSDINSAIGGIWITSNTIEMADTILLPLQSLLDISQKQVPNLPMTVYDWIQRYNVFTLQTRQPLTIMGVRGLEAAGSGGTGRMVAYRKDPSVLKMHIPMPHRFFPVWQEGPLVFKVPGIFRLGGLEIRRPGAVRYLDKIRTAP